ncbi:helix-turn-helix transcriptional regulator [Nonomuraea rosea]|uniref:Helix-turn-helix transcriptional regulator n=1 Tax=Nonomuraea rosea TaxID=638574 RepID=A0ABP6W6Y0_9ACTN
MSLRHALLALLEAGAMTGYELAKQFDQSVAYVWHAQHSQIYTELRKLEAEGLVVAETLARGDKALATKRAYTLTEDGEHELRRWVGDVEELPAVRDSAYVKATYLEYGSYQEARAQFRAHRAHYEALRDRYEMHVDQLARRETALLRRRLAGAPAASHDAIVAYKVHAYRGLISRARTEIEWANRGLELIDRLSDDGVLPK